MRAASSFLRKKPSLNQQPTVLVICEDKKSGKRYLDDASTYFRANFKIRVHHCGKTDPLGIVQEAIKEKAKYDRVYCVIDRDQHENFDQAIANAKNHSKIEIIDSHPCFEFWALLHFGFSRKPYKSTDKKSSGELLIKDLKTKPGFENYDKGADISLFKALLGQPFETARATSPRVLEQAIQNSDLNPSTKMHLLIDRMEELSEPQKA